MTDASTIKVTLLGTGTPVPALDAFGTATLIEAGGLKLLLDCGRGAMIRLTQMQIAASEIDAVFLSHYHSDHYSGLFDLLMTGAIPHWFGGRREPMQIYGPAGLEDVTAGLWQASAPDRAIRIADSEIEAGWMTMTPQIYEEGVIFDRNGVRVTAIEVDHGDFVKPAYAFRIDHAGRSFVHSGDTRFNENLIRQAAGCDVLVHEVAAARPEVIAASDAIRTVLNHHITPDRLAEVFARVQPRMAFLTHLIRLGANRPEVADLVAEIGAVYDGPVIVAEDLMSILIGNAVSVIPFHHGSK